MVNNYHLASKGVRVMKVMTLPTDWVLLVTVSVPPLLDKPKRLIRWRVNVLGESSRGVSLINRLSLAS